MTATEKLDRQRAAWEVTVNMGLACAPKAFRYTVPSFRESEVKGRMKAVHFGSGILARLDDKPKKVGATSIALTRGHSKRDALVDAGAAHVIATDEQDLVKEILAITDDKGARIVFDPVGGPTVVKLTQAMARFSILFIYGALSPEPTPLPLLNVLVNGLTIRGYSLMEVTTDPARLERGKRFINEGLADGSFRPIIARTFPLEEIVEAHRFMESNQQIGKIVVTV